MSSPRSALLAVASIGALSAALTGCSMGPVAGDAPASGAASSSPAPTTAPPAAAGLSAVPTACPPDSLLENDLGLSVVSTGGGADGGCVYTGAKVIVTINFAAEPGMTAEQAETQTRAQGTTSAFQSVPGVGDAAFYDEPVTGGTTGSYIVVLTGSVGFHIVTNADVPVDKMTKAAQDIIAAG